MVNKIEQQRIYNLLSDALMSLCKNSLNYNKKFTVEGLLGITLDENEVLLININDKYQMRAHSQDPGHRTAPREMYPPEQTPQGSDDVYIRDTSTPTRRRHRDQESPEENLPKRAHIAYPSDQKQSGVRVKEEKISDSEADQSQQGASHFPSGRQSHDPSGMPRPSSDSPVVMVVPSSDPLSPSAASRTLSPTPSTDESSAQGSHMCPHCNQAYTYASALSRHIRSTHQGRRDHQCWLCSKTYARSEDLRKHLQRVHQQTYTASQLRQQRTLTEMPSTSTGFSHPERMMMSPSPSVESIDRLDEHARWNEPRMSVMSPEGEETRTTIASEASDTRDTTYMQEHFSTDSLNVDLQARLHTDSNSGVG